MIEGVRVKKLRPIPDDRGFLMEILRADEDLFEGFGQCYVTLVRPRIVKGWHYHKKQIDHFICLGGAAKVVLYDTREKSKTRGEVNEYVMSLEEPMLLKIPAFVLHGFTAAGNRDAMILNIPTEPYHYKDPDEFRVSPFSKEIPYDWGDIDRERSR